MRSKDDGRDFATMPVLEEQLLDHQKQYPAIEQTRWMERDGHIQMTVPLDAGIPVDPMPG